MNLGEREVAEDKAQPVAHRRLQGLDNRVRGPAIGALIVTVLDQRHGRVGAPLRVIVLVHWDGETHGRATLPALRPSRADRIPSAPGLTPTGETWLQRI